MLDILDKYLNSATTPEMKTVIDEAHQAFDLVGLNHYETDFEELLLLSDNVDSADTVDSIVNLTKLFQSNILKEHNIKLSDDSTISTATLFINGLMHIQDYSNKEELLKTTTLDLNANEVLAEIIALVSNKNADELLLDIESVSDSCISAIKDLLTVESNEVTEEEDLIRQKYIDTFKLFCKYVNKKLRIETILKDGLNVGFPFVIYANILGRELEELTVDAASAELLGMAIISSDGANNPISIIKENMEHYISDIDKATKIDIRVNQLLMGFK